jgi:hypothetical protein
MESKGPFPVTIKLIKHISACLSFQLSRNWHNIQATLQKDLNSNRDKMPHLKKITKKLKQEKKRLTL